LPERSSSFGALEDEDVGVDGHAHREDEAGQTRQRQGDRDEAEDRQDDDGVVDQRETRHRTGQSVMDEHEQEDEADADDAGQDAGR
jgi:hypothetical protein